MRQSEAASLPDKRPCTEKKEGVLSVDVRAGLDHTTYMKCGRTCERQAESICAPILLQGEKVGSKEEGIR